MDEEGFTRRERKELQRQERREAENHARKHQKTGKQALIALLVLGFGAAAVYLARELLTPLPGRAIPSQGQQHIEIGQPHGPYNSNPPTSGPHYTQQASWGVHKATIPDEYIVHNLEHGGIVVHYHCDTVPFVQHKELVITDATSSATQSATQATPSAQASEECRELEAQLTQVINQYPAKVILMPNPKIETRIALTAWTRLDTFDEIDPARVKKFIDAWINRGPEDVPDNMPSKYFP